MRGHQYIKISPWGCGSNGGGQDKTSDAHNHIGLSITYTYNITLHVSWHLIYHRYSNYVSLKKVTIVM